MIDTLKKLRSKVKIGIVGGSDMSKQIEQLGKTGAWTLLLMHAWYVP